MNDLSEYLAKDIANSQSLIDKVKTPERTNAFSKSCQQVLTELTATLDYSPITKREIKEGMSGKLPRSSAKVIVSQQLAGNTNQPIRFSEVETISSNTKIDTPPIRICVYLHNSPICSMDSRLMGLNLEYLDNITQLLNPDNIEMLMPNLNVPKVELVVVIGTETPKGIYAETFMLNEEAIKTQKQNQHQLQTPDDIKTKFIELAHQSPNPENVNFHDFSEALILKEFSNYVTETRSDGCLPLIFLGLPINLGLKHRFRQNNYYHYDEILAQTINDPFIIEPLYQGDTNPKPEAIEGQNKVRNDNKKEITV